MTETRGLDSPFQGLAVWMWADRGSYSWGEVWGACSHLAEPPLLPGSAAMPGSLISPEMCLFLPPPASNKQALDIRMSHSEQEVSLAR